MPRANAGARGQSHRIVTNRPIESGSHARPWTFVRAFRPELLDPRTMTPETTIRTPASCCPICSTLEPEIVAAVGAMARPRSFAKGEFLVHQGSKNSGFF